MAGAALVAMADGTVTFSESNRVDEIVQRVKQLKAFDPHEAMDCFQAFVDGLADDPARGHDEAHAAIAAVADDPEAAPLLVRICLAIGRADGHVDPEETAEIEHICKLLRIDPATAQERG